MRIHSRSVWSQTGNSNTWFLGIHLLPLLRKVLILPDGPETDLLQYLDRCEHKYSFISQSSTLLFFLFVTLTIIFFSSDWWSLWTCCATWSSETKWQRTRWEQVSTIHHGFLLYFLFTFFFFAAICAQTGIWTELYKIEDTFTKPLRVGLNMTRAHYEKELQNTMEDKKAKTRGQSSFFFSSTTCIMNVKNTVIIAETGLFWKMGCFSQRKWRFLCLSVMRSCLRWRRNRRFRSVTVSFVPMILNQTVSLSKLKLEDPYIFETFSGGAPEDLFNGNDVIFI